MSDYSIKGIVERQKTEPIYMTNGCCEVAHASPEVFKLLDIQGAYLSFNQKTGKMEEGKEGEADWYPLTLAENEFIAEDYSQGPFGGLLMSYTLLYQGKKWFAPSVEVCHIEEEVFSRESYGDSLYETGKEALEAANKFADAIRPRIEELGGIVYVEPDSGDDRHTVSLMFPTDMVTKKFKKFDEWNAYLNAILQPFNDLK